MCIAVRPSRVRDEEGSGGTARFARPSVREATFARRAAAGCRWGVGDWELYLGLVGLVYSPSRSSRRLYVSSFPIHLSPVGRRQLAPGGCCRVPFPLPLPPPLLFARLVLLPIPLSRRLGLSQDALPSQVVGVPARVLNEGRHWTGGRHHSLALTFCFLCPFSLLLAALASHSHPHSYAKRICQGRCNLVSPASLLRKMPSWAVSPLQGRSARPCSSLSSVSLKLSLSRECTRSW